MRSASPTKFLSTSGATATRRPMDFALARTLSMEETASTKADREKGRAENSI